MKEVFRKTMEEAKQEVAEWVDIFRQSGIHLEILDIRVVPEHEYEESEDEEYNEYGCCYAEDENEEFSMSALREGGYYDFERYNIDLQTAGEYGYAFLIHSEDYIRSLDSLSLIKKLSTIEMWARNLSGIEVDWKLDIGTISSYSVYVPDAEEDLRQIIDDYATNLSREYLDAIGKKIESKISEWEWYLSKI